MNKRNICVPYVWVQNSSAYASKGTTRQPRHQYDPTDQENHIDASYGLACMTFRWKACLLGCVVVEGESVRILLRHIWQKMHRTHSAVQKNGSDNSGVSYGHCKDSAVPTFRYLPRSALERYLCIVCYVHTSI